MAAVNEYHENKRVSFVAEEQVHMLPYDNGGEAVVRRTKELNGGITFTGTDDPPSKVKVRTEDSEIPRPISPPAQITSPVEATIEVPNRNLTVNSPGLPSITKRMERESDNPFRPDEYLYHEVNPIIEAYKNRPFPPSPDKNSHSPNLKQPVASPSLSAVNSVISNSMQKKHESLDTKFDEPNFTPKRAPDKQGTSGRSSSLAEARREVEYNRTVTDSTTIKMLPAPSKPEVVHLEEKKRCAPCCSLQ